MARENLEEWGSSAWFEMETIKAVVEAYAAGEIELPPMPKDTPKKRILYAPHFVSAKSPSDVGPVSDQRPYSMAQVARLIGWTRSRDKDQPNLLRASHACETAFRALELMELGLLKAKDCRNLTREQLAALVAGQYAIYEAPHFVQDEAQVSGHQRLSDAL
jgi:hypothetical protein